MTSVMSGYRETAAALATKVTQLLEAEQSGSALDLITLALVLDTLMEQACGEMALAPLRDDLQAFIAHGFLFLEHPGRCIES